MKSTYFEYGYVLLALPPADDELLPESAERKQNPVPNQGSTRHAIVLSRQGGGAELLVVKRGTCPDASVYRTVKVWVVPASQLRSIQEIYREDIITWKTLNERPCPGLLAPGAGTIE